MVFAKATLCLVVLGGLCCLLNGCGNSLKHPNNRGEEQDQHKLPRPPKHRATTTTRVTELETTSKITTTATTTTTTTCSIWTTKVDTVAIGYLSGDSHDRYTL